MASNVLLQTLSKGVQNIFSLNIDVFDKAIDINDIEKSIQAQIDHLDLEHQLQEIIQQKLECSYVKELIVTNFEKFINEKILHPHYHSKDNQTNYIKSISIFYRHGLSKIISKMMEDLNNDSHLLSFFLEEIINAILEIEDNLFIGFINEHLSNSEKEEVIFEIMDDVKTEKYIRENANPEKINQLLLDLYTEVEFNQFLNNPELNINPEDKQKWMDYYEDISIRKEWKEEENKKKEMNIVKDLGITEGLKKIENIFKGETKIVKPTVTQYISKYTKGGKRCTKKKLNK
jgi:hypothetical protein